MPEIEKLEIFYIRHAEPQVGTNADRHPCDHDLSPLGLQQAELLGERLKYMKFDAVFTSPLLRCVRTVAGAVSRMEEKPVIEIMPALIEKNTPAGYIGQDLDYLRRYYDKLIRCPDIIWGGPEQYFESVDKQDCLNRARAVHEYLRQRFGFGKRILVCAHASYGNSFLQSGVSLMEEDKTQFINTIYHSSLSKYKYTSDGRERISFSNDISHLRSILPEYEYIV